MARAIISGINGAAGHGRIFHRLVHRSSTRNFVGGGGGNVNAGKGVKEGRARRSTMLITMGNGSFRSRCKSDFRVDLRCRFFSFLLLFLGTQ